jgi:hypothetical protein
MRLSVASTARGLLAAWWLVGGCYADHSWVDAPDASDDAPAPMSLDPCGIPSWLTDTVFSIVDPAICASHGPRSEHWVYSPSHGRCLFYYCDCPDPECTWDDGPIYGCIFDEDGGEHRGDFPKDYCLFTTREECECRCTDTC